MNCSNCNAPILEEDKFCGECGTPVGKQPRTSESSTGQVEDSAADVEIKRTSGRQQNCNAAIEKEYVFCGQCGQKSNPGTTSKSTEKSTLEDVTSTCRKCGASLGAEDQLRGKFGTQVEQVTRVKENSVGARGETDSATSSKALRTHSSLSLLKILASRFFVVVIAYACGLLGAFAIAVNIEYRFIYFTVFICSIAFSAIAVSVTLGINMLVHRLSGGWNIFGKSGSYLIVIGSGGVAYLYICNYFGLEEDEIEFYIPIIVIAIVVTTLVQIIDLVRERKG